MSSENDKHLTFREMMEPILDLSREVSVIKGRNGVLDSPEQAWKKLFEGDENKKVGDRAEADEILEVVAGEAIDPVELMLEAADVMYFACKLHLYPEVYNSLCKFTSGLGLLYFDDLTGDCRVKYQTRVEGLKAGLSKEARKENERKAMSEHLEQINYDPRKINPGLIRATIGDLKRVSVPR